MPSNLSSLSLSLSLSFNLPLSLLSFFLSLFFSFLLFLFLYFCVSSSLPFISFYYLHSCNHPHIILSFSPFFTSSLPLFHLFFFILKYTLTLLITLHFISLDLIPSQTITSQFLVFQFT